jgi:phospholipase/carboxylesterase
MAVNLEGIDPRSVLWSAPPEERAGKPLVVLMHGFGADESDLFGLARFFQPSRVVASLRAPLVLGPGFAWFPPRQFGGDSEIDDAAQGVLKWLGALQPQPSSVGLFGFSQGGAMALQLMRHRPGGFSYAVVLSGFIVGENHAGDAELSAVRPPVFWGRGALDFAIPHTLIEATSAWLPAHSTLEKRLYQDTGHGISEQELFDVLDFIEGVDAVGSHG